nr:MAG TPA: hypothetical protein [Caudoviricetes sp.]
MANIISPLINIFFNIVKTSLSLFNKKDPLLSRRS